MINGKELCNNYNNANVPELVAHLFMLSKSVKTLTTALSHAQSRRNQMLRHDLHLCFQLHHLTFRKLSQFQSTYPDSNLNYKRIILTLNLLLISVKD